MDSNQRALSEVQGLLTAISGRILQVSDRKAGVILGTVTKTVLGASVASSVMGVVGALGTASTGTAIAGLAGAAKTTASLYWIGGLVGGGVAAGTVAVGAGALGAGIYASVKVRRALLGQSRRDQLSDREATIIVAVEALVRSIRSVLESDKAISARELALFSRLGLTPIAEAVQTALDDGVFADLTVYNRARLRGHVNNLRSQQARLERL